MHIGGIRVEKMIYYNLEEKMTENLYIYMIDIDAYINIMHNNYILHKYIYFLKNHLFFNTEKNIYLPSVKLRPSSLIPIVPDHQ